MDEHKYIADDNVDIADAPATTTTTSVTVEIQGFSVFGNATPESK